MIYIIIGASILIIVIVIITLLINNAKKIQLVQNKLNLVTEQIKKSLYSKLQFYTDIQNTLKDGNSIFKNGIKNESEFNESVFNINQYVNSLEEELQNYIDNQRNFKPNEDENSVLENLYDENINGVAYKNYYNEQATLYNKLINKFPTKLFKKIKHYQIKKTFNDSKNERFEILKKK